MVLEFVRSSPLCKPGLLFGQSSARKNPPRYDLFRDLRDISRKGFASITRIARSRQGAIGVRRLDRRGFGTLGGSFALLAVTIGLGLSQLMFRIGDRIKDQVSLDQCTGKHLLRMRAAALAMEGSYLRLDIYRGAVVTACVLTAGSGCVPAISAFNKVAQIERAIQNGVKLEWAKNAEEWNLFAKKTCDLPSLSYRNGFPSFPFEVIKDTNFSLIDIRASKFSQKPRPEIKLSIRTLSLQSEATLKKEGLKNAWSVYWSK